MDCWWQQKASWILERNSCIANVSFTSMCPRTKYNVNPNVYDFDFQLPCLLMTHGDFFFNRMWKGKWDSEGDTCNRKTTLLVRKTFSSTELADTMIRNKRPMQLNGFIALATANTLYSGQKHFVLPWTLSLQWAILKTRTRVIHYQTEYNLLAGSPCGLWGGWRELGSAWL